jgi:hypothetical protein
MGYWINIDTMNSFLRYVHEARVVRRPNDLERYTFQEIQQLVYISFLALALLKNNEQTKQWAKNYAAQTMTYGDFGMVRGSATDLHNLISVLDGRPDITAKLKNKRDAEVQRQRQSFPTLAAKRFLRKLQDDYDFLHKLERLMRISDSNLRNAKRQIANYPTLSAKDQASVIKSIQAMVSQSMPNSELHKKLKSLTK